MNLGHQIKYLRQRDYLSQEDLAEKLYVSRQTISNWENDKSYPDIHNLLMLSSLFDTSLDDLVKGDVEIMERKLKETRFNGWSHLMVWPMLMAAILIGPALYHWGMIGYIVEAILLGVAIVASLKVDSLKKSYHIQTYDRIVAFMNGKDPNEVHTTKLRDIMTSIYSFVLVVGIFIIIVLISLYVFKPY
ncbi:helix-turn-helix transcriptional regulator [Staphylococcus edaphicus]|uniref:Helix-turn-helix domain-containing protein n=1 Tax=Staphylococcus edaphicus TaxID=1955013 RepID=A0A2C6U8C4_9STAP|nr:helix-turn-helix transcriptional regulator [Staphylococcus edaphicus]PHK50052.1 transcriptional regulator [Staphylococcus edaphicus]UQW81545.1 helix-turn-helix domain-containing protein [Staphylococcus edaphicus]